MLATTLVLSVALFAQSPTTADPKPAAGLRIFDAQYGDVGTQRLCDATPVIAALCEGKDSCAFPVGNALCGDPAFGTRKKLQMAFKCAGSAPQLLIAPEPTNVRIGCPAATGERNRT